jgi:hypothetical protein
VLKVGLTILLGEIVKAGQLCWFLIIKIVLIKDNMYAFIATDEEIEEQKLLNFKLIGEAFVSRSN